MAELSGHGFQHWSLSRSKRSARASRRDVIGLIAATVLVSLFTLWALQVGWGIRIVDLIPAISNEAPLEVSLGLIFISIIGVVITLKLLNVWYRTMVKVRRLSEDLREDQALADDLRISIARCPNNLSIPVEVEHVSHQESTRRRREDSINGSVNIDHRDKNQR